MAWTLAKYQGDGIFGWTGAWYFVGIIPGGPPLIIRAVDQQIREGSLVGQILARAVVDSPIMASSFLLNAKVVQADAVSPTLKKSVGVGEKIQQARAIE